MAKVFSNDMVAHVWAQMSQNEGRSNNGQFYFTGAALYSYGSHFLAGYIMPDGVALLNASNYSVSTSKHMGYARRAVSHRPSFSIINLAVWRDPLEWIASGEKVALTEFRTKRVRQLLLEEAHHLRDTGYRMNESAGAYLARMAGFRSNVWPAIVRERERLDKAEHRKAEAAKAARAKSDAIRFATMPDADWRALVQMSRANHSYNYICLARDIFHAQGYGREHGFSAKRMATLKTRRAQALYVRDNYDLIRSLWKGRAGLREAIEIVRSVERMEAERDAGQELGIVSREAAARKAIHALRILARSTAFPPAARQRLYDRADGVERFILPSLQHKLAEWQEAERVRIEAERAERIRLANLEKAEQIAAWYEGAPVRITFDAASGGAAMRINGDLLETSHGASVPLAHAIKAFRFVKLCRERGEAWARNGKTVRVGHFQVDRITAEGDFRAGCHNFTWPEIERVAALAGVADETGDDSAVVTSHGSH